MFHKTQSEDSDSGWIALSPVTVASSRDCEPPSRVGFEKLLEEDFDTLSHKQHRILVVVVQQLIKLPEKDLYTQGFLKLLSLKKQLNFLRLLSLGKHFNILISFLNIIEENNYWTHSEESAVLSFLVQELKSKLSIEELPKELLLRICSLKRQLDFFKILNLEQQFEILRLLNLENLSRGIECLKELYGIDQPSKRQINIQIFVKILTTLPQSDCAHVTYMDQVRLKFNFLEQFNKRYLQNVIKISDDLIEVLHALPKDCWKNFLVKFDLKFLQKKINNFNNAVFILGVLKELERPREVSKIKNLKKFLEKITTKHTASTAGDKLKKYIVESSSSSNVEPPSLEPSDSRSRLMLIRRLSSANDRAGYTERAATSSNGGLLRRFASMVLSKIRRTREIPNTNTSMDHHVADLTAVEAEAVSASASTPISRQEKKPRLV